MGVTIAATRVAVPTASGVQDITTTDLGGLTPSAALFLWNTATADGTQAAHAEFGLGMTDGTRQWGFTHIVADAQATSFANKTSYNNACVVIRQGGGTQANAAFSSWLTNGIRINWGSASSIAPLLTVVFFAGTDVSAYVGTFSVDGLTNGQAVDVTAPGFEPDVLVVHGGGTTFTLNGTLHNTAQPSLGLVHNNGAGTVTQRVLHTTYYHLVATATQVAHYREDSGVVEAHYASATRTDVRWRASFGSFDANGFTATVTTGTTNGNREVGYLALKFANHASWVGTIDTPTATGNQSYTGPGFTPQALLIAGTHLTATTNSAYTADDDASGLMVGVVDVDEAYSHASRNDGDAETSDTSSMADDALALLDGAGNVDFQASLTSFDATGFTLNFATTQGDTAHKWLVLAVEEDGATGYTLTAEAGSYSTTGQAAGLRAARKLTAAAGSASLTGQTAALLHGRKLAAAVGEYALTGTAVSLLHGRRLLAAAGAYTLTGMDAGLRAARILAAEAGAYTLTGLDANLTRLRVYTLSAEAGSYTLTGQSAGLVAGRKLGAALGEYALSGLAVGLLAGRKLTTATGDYTLTGQAAALLFGRRLAAALGQYTLTGYEAGLIYQGASGSYTLTAEAGSYALVGQDVGLRVARLMAAALGEYTLSGQVAALIHGRRLAAAQSSYGLTGQDAALLAARRMAADLATYTLTGQTARLLRGYPLIAETGSYSLTGQDTGLVAARRLSAAAGAYTLTGQAVTFTWSGLPVQIVLATIMGVKRSGTVGGVARSGTVGGVKRNGTVGG